MGACGISGPLEGGEACGISGPLGGGAYLKFFDRQRQNHTMSMESKMLCSFNNNYELLHYTKNL